MYKGPEVGETMGVTGKCLSIGNPRRNRTLQVAPLQSSLRETCGAPSPTFGRNPVLLGGASPPVPWSLDKELPEPCATDRMPVSSPNPCPQMMASRGGPSELHRSEDRTGTDGVRAPVKEIPQSSHCCST